MLPGDAAEQLRPPILGWEGLTTILARRESVQALGGEEKVFPDANGGFFTKDIPQARALDKFHEITAKLDEAAGKMERAAQTTERAHQGKPTLGGPGSDPGQKISN